VPILVILFTVVYARAGGGLAILFKAKNVGPPRTKGIGAWDARRRFSYCTKWDHEGDHVDFVHCY
jgi:hypothetical protein